MHNASKQPNKPTKPSRASANVADKTASATKDEVQGEGSYSGTRDYQASLKNYLATANVEKNAHDAAPHSAAEANDMEKAEEVGRKHATKMRPAAKKK